ncbi:hypothetical protein BGZ49_009830 [Haplosporangium sp. Z 27]|nr:hypothetical protein BGZ49_009830 [Haplosporangium sp. Z 27]
MSHKRSNGPSIFDLSSGEELLALHLGNNEHKRMRDCEPMSPTASIDSLGEVFDYQDDVNLLPIRNYLPTQPSPAKKVRLGRSSQHSSLRFLSEEESNAEIQEQGVKLKQSHSQRATTNHGFLRRTKQKRKSCIYRSGSRFVQGNSCNVITNTYDDNETDGAFEYDKEVKASTRDHDEKETHNEIDSKAERAVVETGNHELIGYHRPVACSLSDGLAIDWKLWDYLDPPNALLPKKLMGNELVLYKRRSSVEFEINKDGYNGRQERKERYDKSKVDYQSSVIIEELDDDEDDDGNMADDEACELSDDGPLLELGEKIMDMDLD